MEDLEFSGTFTNKDGITNLGLKYERLNIANIVAKLLTNPNFRNDSFEISSSEPKYGIFDDIVLCTKSKKYAIQTKYVNNNDRILELQDFYPTSKKYSILKYFQDFKEHEETYEGFTLILYTNAKFVHDKNNFHISCKDKRWDIKIIRERKPDELVNTSKDENCCYKFAVIDSNQNGEEQAKFKKFLKQFAFYTDQTNVEELRDEILNRVKDGFDENFQDEDIDRYMQFVGSWHKCEQDKVKLGRSFMRNVLTLSLLHRYVRFLTFNDSKVVGKEKFLRDAISQFQITVLAKNKTVEKLWRDLKSEKLEEVAHKYLKQYHHLINKHKEIDSLDDLRSDEEWTKLFWLLDKCPLVVENNSTTRKIISSMSSKKFVLVGEDKSEENLEGFKVFSKLSDLRNCEIYRKILETYTCSIQHKKDFLVKALTDRCPKFDEIVTTDELLEMTEKPLIICNETEEISEHYVLRFLEKITIKSEFLQEMDEETLSVVCCNDGFQTSKNNIKCTDEEYSREKFQEFCTNSKIRKCHQFRLTTSGQLEWVRSRGPVADLRQFLTTSRDSIKEKNLVDYEDDNNVNVVCADPGMGKTQLMKNLKNNKRSSLTWTIMIYVRNHTKHFQENKNDIRAFKNYIMERTRKRFEDNEFFLKFLNLMKDSNLVDVRYIWDGLDEIDHKDLETVMDVIEGLSSEGSKHWITSRNHLKQKLEDRFNVFSKTINKFNDREQKKYINYRLKNKCENLQEVSDTVIKIIRDHKFEYVLQVPLLIFILTDLYLKNSSKSEHCLFKNFSISKLYKHFIDAKFSVYYTEKQNCDVTNAVQNSENESRKSDTIQNYQKVATRTHFGTYCEKSWDLNYGNFLNKIKEKGDIVGIITRIVEENNPVWYHSSVSEYFAALYLAENGRYKKFCVIKQEKYKNIRAFLNSILENS